MGHGPHLRPLWIPVVTSICKSWEPSSALGSHLTWKYSRGGSTNGRLKWESKSLDPFPQGRDRSWSHEHSRAPRGSEGRVQLNWHFCLVSSLVLPASCPPSMLLGMALPSWIPCLNDLCVFGSKVEISELLCFKSYSVFAVVVQWLSYVWLFVTPWTAAPQAHLSFTASQGVLKFMSVESVMPCNHLNLCHPSLSFFSSSFSFI